MSEILNQQNCNLKEPVQEKLPLRLYLTGQGCSPTGGREVVEGVMEVMVVVSSDGGGDSGRSL